MEFPGGCFDFSPQLRFRARGLYLQSFRIRIYKKRGRGEGIQTTAQSWSASAVLLTLLFGRVARAGLSFLRP
jgi:hypothetical protein